MCGIAGYSLSYPQPNLGNWISSAQDFLAHRGPDDHGYFLDDSNSICLVHTRLSIQDLSQAGHQPMLSSDGSVALSYNGEIYNVSELRSELQDDGWSFESSSDTEVLLALYLRLTRSSEGRPCSSSLTALLNRINGIFAFAIWDSRCKSMLLVRDAFGVKPLYMHSFERSIFFSSELKALTRNDLSLDPPSIVNYLTYLWCPGDGTPSAYVRKVAPGECVWITKGLVEEKFTWYHLPVFKSSTNSISLVGQAIAGTENYLRSAVHRQLLSDVPVGAFLSGGLDSSSIVAFAREIHPDLRCFTINVSGFGNEGFSDDLPFARRTATHLGVPLEVVPVEAAEMAAMLETMVWQLDEPLADLAPLNLLLISRLAREQGIKVLLSGAGGDDLFSGYRRHLALDNEQWWRWLPRPLRLRLRAFTGHLSPSHPLTRRLRKAFSGAHLEGDARLVHYFRWIERSDLEALYSPAFRAALGRSRVKDPMLEFLNGLPNNTPSLERMLALEQRFFLTDHNLTYTDKMSMAVGVEVRVPFLDLDLVEFAATIPPQFKQRGRHGKWILKKAMEPYLPKDVIYRTKSGFGVPLRRWLQVDLRDWLYDTLSIDRLQRRGLFDPQAVHALISNNAVGRVDASYTLLSLACIEIWCMYFIDKKTIPLV
jgi:asparagine synthase (glutamine-hydrolysing)